MHFSIFASGAQYKVQQSQCALNSFCPDELYTWCAQSFALLLYVLFSCLQTVVRTDVSEMHNVCETLAAVEFST